MKVCSQYSFHTKREGWFHCGVSGLSAFGGIACQPLAGDELKNYAMKNKKPMTCLPSVLDYLNINIHST